MPIDAARHRRVARRSRVAGLLAVVALGTLLVPPTTSARAAAPLEPPAGALLGAYVQASGSWAKAAVQADITALETFLGRKLGIGHHYYSWAKTFPTWQETWDLEHGRIPLISWGGTSTVDINAGIHDDWIRARADAVKALGKPVFLRWFYEMDASKLSANAGPPATYIAAWRRVHRIFAERGATNVVWVWCPTSGAFASGEAQTYYPGDAYVDWIAADGYNWAPGKPSATWRTIGDIFRAFYDWAATSGKPLMIAETGTEERNPGEKAAWFRDAAVTLRTAFPAVKAFVYFDSRSTDFYDQYFDWRVDSTPGSYAAFRDLANQPHLNPDTLVPVGVQMAGDGTGSVASSPGGIDCGLTCAAVFEEGASITLTATPAASSTFAGWSGACTGSSRTCTFAPGGATAVTATFSVRRHQVTIDRTGAGAGTVSGQGFLCPTDCSEIMVHGSSDRVASAADAGSAFAGWGGPCAGSGLECVVTALSATTIGVIFDRVPAGSHPLTLIRSGTPRGTVTAAPGGVTCAMTCVLSYRPGESVTVTASADQGSSFAGWSGDCSGGAPACSVTMDGPRIVEAGFAPMDDVHQPVVDVEQRGRRRRQRVELTIMNQGNVPDAYVVTGSRGSRRLRVRYFQDGANITAAAIDGTFVVDHLAPGGSTDVLMLVSRTRKAGRRPRGTFPVTVRSLEQPAVTATAAPRIRLRGAR